MLDSSSQLELDRFGLSLTYLGGALGMLTQGVVCCVNQNSGQNIN